MKKEDLGLLFLRIGLGGVFLWFGIDKFFNPVFWTKWIPDWFGAVLPVDVFTFVYALGVFETFIGLLVLIGFYTRIAAGLAGVSLFGIIASWGLNEIMIRDTGLLFLALGIAVSGPGHWSIERWLLSQFRKQRKI